MTSSNWFSLDVVHDRHYIYGESGFSATSKELPSAFKILHGRPGSTQIDRCETEAHTKAKEDSWALQQMSCSKRTSTNACNTKKATRHQQLWMWSKLVLSMQQIVLQTEEYSMESTKKSHHSWCWTSLLCCIDLLFTEQPEEGVLVSFKSRTTRSSSSSTIWCSSSPYSTKKTTRVWVWSDS